MKKRILLKMSGEALAGNTNEMFDKEILDYLVEVLKSLQDDGIQVGMVIGGGNIYRGKLGKELDLDDYVAHTMGMTATYINGLALCEYFKNNNLKSKLITAVSYEGVGELFDKYAVLNYLNNGYITIFAGGTGQPYFTTDTGGVLRAIEIEADLLIKATNVDGLYDKDPKKFEDAVIYENVTHDEVISKNLKVMDLTAMALARDENITIKVVNFFKKGAILNAVSGKNEGTTVTNNLS